MVMKLSMILSHITTIPNYINSKAISEFHNYMKSIGTSENYQIQNVGANSLADLPKCFRDTCNFILPLNGFVLWQT